MKPKTFHSSLILGSALALAACGDDSAATSSSGGGSGGTASTASTTSQGTQGNGGAGQGGEGQGANAQGPGSTSSGTQSGGGDDGGAGPGGPGSGGDSSTTNSGNPGSGGATGSGGEGGSDPVCPAGVIQCEGSLQRTCDGLGGFIDQECAPGGCIAGVGCTVCQPDVGTCNGNTSSVCKSDGSGFDVYECDPIQGSTCDAGNGHCTGACAPEDLGNSYIGCDYFPTVTLNSLLVNSPGFSSEGTFAVAVANISDLPADITVTRGAATVVTATVAADSVQIIPLPWVYELKNGTSTQVLADGAYRLRTTQPVTVYQYNPIEYATPTGNTYTNDASLLLPSNAWTGNYRVVSRQAWLAYSGFYAVTAKEDGTTVTLTRSNTSAAIAGAGVQGDGSGTVVLDAGDVLQVVSATDGNTQQSVDLTGSLVAADKPVQVIGGHDCTDIPFNITACDHIEESIPPIETLANEYIVTPPLIPTGGNVPKAEMVRVIATEASTTISYDPPQGGAPSFLANPGDYFEIDQTAADFVVTGDKPILVAQYALGQDAGGGSGDPDQAMAVATEQYRDEYLFHAPTNYDANYVNITAPTGAVITLDGSVVGGFVAIGASGFGVARVALSNAGDGNHYITGDDEFGISVYGYGQYTSYWYPGGLDLEQVN